MGSSDDADEKRSVGVRGVCDEDAWGDGPFCFFGRTIGGTQRWTGIARANGWGGGETRYATVRKSDGPADAGKAVVNQARGQPPGLTVLATLRARTLRTAAFEALYGGPLSHREGHAWA
ncbi:hypothetical protein MMC17_004775 [Xylographa soralifera]|nr:hypothetical protein [Xylographa soralifera]